MKNTLSAAVALPTVVAIALGGLLMAAPAASAAPAPVEQSEGGAVPVEETAPVTSPTPAPTAEPEVPAAEPELTAEPGAPVADPEPAADAEVAQAAAASPTAEAAADPDVTVSSPVDGQVLTSAGVRVEGTVPVGSRVAVTTSEGTGGDVPVIDGAFAEAVSLPALSTTASYRVTIRVTGADGADLGSIDRTVVVPGLPTSTAPTLSSPTDGSFVEAVPDAPGYAATGTVTLVGTGTPGATVDVDLEPVFPETAYGYDDAPPVVRADGSWTDDVSVPFGRWRFSASQLVVDADGFVTSLPSRAVSVVVDVARPVAAFPAAPVVTSPAQGTTVVGRPATGKGLEGSLTFTVTGTGTPGTAIGIYGFFTEGRGPVDAYAAAARGEGGAPGEFEPMVAGNEPDLVGADGTWSITQTLVGPGTYSFAAFSLFDSIRMSGPSEVVTFTLVAPTAGTATATPASLAFTGDDGVGSALAGGVLAIGLGAAALTVVRRRARRVSDAAAGSARRA